MKKILAMVLSLALVATMAITGSIAYLQDTDEAVNVMTLGNVDIDQIEQEWNEDYTALQDFTQEKPLYPYVGNMAWKNIEEGEEAYRSFAMNNVVDKYVSVKNTGKSDAYVRTIIALEMGDYAYEDFNMIGVSINAENGSQFKFPGAWNWTDDFAATIDGKTYNIMVAVHEDAIEPGETTIPSLNQVYMTKESTNETCEKLDGNKNGTYDILVISQAVQSMGFEATAEKTAAQVALDEAFGEVNAEKVAEWFGGVVVPSYADNAEELVDAIERGGIVYVENDADIDDGITMEDTQLKLEENTFSADYVNVNGNSTIENGTMNVGTSVDYGVIGRAGSETTINDVAITSAGGGVGVTDGAELTFNSGSVHVDSASTSGRYVFYVSGEGSKLTINDGEFSWDKNDNQKRAYIYTTAGATVYVNGGTFGPASTRSDYKAGIMGEGTVIIKGGTFGFDPTTWVAEGYEAVPNGSTWTVSAKA